MPVTATDNTSFDPSKYGAVEVAPPEKSNSFDPAKYGAVEVKKKVPSNGLEVGSKGQLQPSVPATSQSKSQESNTTAQEPNFGMASFSDLAKGQRSTSDNTIQTAPQAAIQAKENVTNIPKWNQEKADYKAKVIKNTPTAILNAAIKSLKIKGINPSNTAQLNKEKQHFQNQVEDGNATVGFDKEGTPGLIENPGLFDAFHKHMMDAINENKESREFKNMNVTDRVSFANKKLQEQPSAYIGEKPTELGSVGAMVGGALPTLGLYGAGAAAGGVLESLAPETGGLSNLALKPVMSFVTNAGGEANKSAMNGVLSRYAQIKKTHPEIADEDAMTQAQKGEDVDRLAGIGTAALFSETGGQLGKSVTKNFIKGAIKSGVDVGAKTALVEGGKDIAHNMEGVTNKSASDIAKDMGIAFAENAPMGAALHGLMGVLTGITKVPAMIKSALKYDVVSKMKPEEINAELDKNVQSGAITPEQAQKAGAELNEFGATLQTVPSYLSDEAKASATGLIIKRNNLLKENEGLDKTAQDLVKSQTDAIDNQLKEIYRTGKPLQVEINPATGETFEKPTYDDVQKQRVQDLADKISKGKKIEDAEDLQAEQQFPEEVKKELEKIKKTETPKEEEVQSDAFKNVNKYLEKNKAIEVQQPAETKSDANTSTSETTLPTTETKAEEPIPSQVEGKDEAQGINGLRDEMNKKIAEVENPKKEISFKAKDKKSVIDKLNKVGNPKVDDVLNIGGIKWGVSTVEKRQIFENGKWSEVDGYRIGIRSNNKGVTMDLYTDTNNFIKHEKSLSDIEKINQIIDEYDQKAQKLQNQKADNSVEENKPTISKDNEETITNNQKNKDNEISNGSSIQKEQENTSRQGTGGTQAEENKQSREEINGEGSGEEKVTGVKKSITEPLRTELGLPKVELPKMGADNIELQKAKERVDNGVSNPIDLVNRILDNKEGYKSEDEVMDMQYYAHQIQSKADNLAQKIAEAETPEAKTELSNQLQQLSDASDRQTEAALIAGNQWGKIGNRMQIVIDAGFNPSREKVFIKDAYDGEIPKDVKQKLDAITKERDEAIAAKKVVEEKLRQRAAKEGVERIKKAAEKTKARDETKEKLKAEEKELLDQVKKALKKDFGNLNAGIPIPKETIEVLGKLAVNYFKQGAINVEALVDKMYNALKDDIEDLDKKQLRDIIAEYEPLTIERETSKLNKKANTLEDKITPTTVKTKNGNLAGVNEPTDFTPQPKQKLEFRKNTEWVKAQQRIANAEYKIKVLKREAFESKKNMYQKGLMWANRVFRLSVLSGYNVLLKLSAAATIGGAGLRIPSEGIGSMWSGIFKSISDKAPIEGGFNVRAQSRFMKEFFNPKKFVQNAVSILKSGQSNLSKRLGSAEYEHVPIMYLPTDLHQIIKDPVKRGIFESSMIKSMAWAEKNGLDINDNLVYQSLENAAYKRANYEIFQEKNALSKKFQELKSNLDKKGNAGATGKFLIDFMIPVSTVPTNIVRRLISTSPLGLGRGFLMARDAYAKGIEKLSTEDADHVMRQLKQGSLGTALYLTGWLAASNFGGLYSGFNPNKKRQEGELASDEMQVNGQMIPKPIQHALPFEIIQMAATARHVYDNYVKNKDASLPEAIYNAGLSSIGALLEQVPVVETGVHAVEATTNPYEAKKLKEDAQRRFEPQILRETGIIPKQEKEVAPTKTRKSTRGTTRSPRKTTR